MQGGRTRRATSLIEVLIVITILGLFSMLTMAKWPMKSLQSTNVTVVVGKARAQAVKDFRPVTIWLSFPDTAYALTAMPDGSIVGLSDAELRRRGRDIPRIQPRIGDQYGGATRAQP